MLVVSWERAKFRTLIRKWCNIPRIWSYGKTAQDSAADIEWRFRRQHSILGIEAVAERMSSKYEIIIYWNEKDMAFVAEVPELPGCMNDGRTYQEAIANVEIVIQQWIETAKELGRTIRVPWGRLLYA